MRKSRFTDEQIALALQQAESGIGAKEICRKYGVSQATFYTWKRRYGGLAPSELKRLKALEKENTQLKKLVADLSLDKQILRDVVSGKI